MKNSPARILAMTSALLAGGAVFGAIAAVLALLLGSLLTGEVYADPRSLGFAGFVGALLGAPLLPLTGWLVLRRVPVGLTIAGTFVGTVVGGVVGWVVSGLDAPVFWAVLGAFIGFVAAAVVLRVRFATPVPRDAIRVPRGG